MCGRIATDSLQIVIPPPRGSRVAAAPAPTAPIAPTADTRLAEAPALPELELSLDAWRSDDFPFWRFDRQVDDLAARLGGKPFAVRLRGEEQHLEEAARQVTLRCQRLAGCRNGASNGAVFERVLSGHRTLFSDGKGPAGAAAERGRQARALDRWQWLLRLDPGAGLAAQIAALFHDFERLTAARQALPQRAEGTAGTAAAAHPGAPRQAATRRGSWIADELLADAGIDLAVRVRVHELIRGHDSSDQPADLGGTAAGELSLLRNAEALSFFSLDSAGHLASAGAEPTRRKVAAILARMSPGCRTQLGSLRLCQPVRQMIAGEMAHLRDAPPQRAAPAGRCAAATPGMGSRAIGEASARLDPLSDRVIGPSGVLGAIDSLVRSDGRPSPALVMSRSRLAVGMLGAAALAPNRLAPLLARAKAIGALGAGATAGAQPPSRRGPAVAAAENTAG